MLVLDARCRKPSSWFWFLPEPPFLMIVPIVTITRNTAPKPSTSGQETRHGWRRIFLLVIDFDENSAGYGKVVRTVPVPPPGERWQMHRDLSHLSSDKKILACGGLLSLLRGQNGIFFFDVSNARHPRFLSSASGSRSSITDDFLPLESGGFLITQMG